MTGRERAPVLRHLEIRLGFVSASFQRYPRPTEGFVGEPPRSHGALPVGAAGAEVLVAVPEAEALWVGLVARSPRVVTLVRVVVEAAGSRVDALAGDALAPGAAPAAGLAVPPTVAVQGLARAAGGSWCFARVAVAPGAPACVALELEAVPAHEVRAPRPRRPTPLRAPAARDVSRERPSALEPADPRVWCVERRVTALVRLVSPDEFGARTGLPLPAPLRPGAAYRGWRLP
jgi:hypothetical protein